MPLGMKGVYTKLFVRFLQFVLGLTIFGIYTADLVAAGKLHTHLSSAWLLASVVGGMSAVLSLVFLLPFVHSYLFFWMDWIIVILHTGIIGVFAKAYIATKIPTNNTKDTKVTGPSYNRMKAAAIVDCVSGILWFMTAVMSSLIFLKLRRARKQTVAA